MYQNFAGSLLLALLISTAAFADEQHGNAINHDAMGSMPQGDAPAVKLTEGVVKSMDLNGGLVTLRHGEIINLKMPAMTMSYRVKDRGQLKPLHAGDKVRFAVDKLEKDYVVTHIELIK